MRLNGMTEVPESIISEDTRPALERPRSGGRSDEAALIAIYQERRAEVFAFLVGMTHDREAAEDLLQDTFIRLIREARAGRMPDEVRAWLFRVASNAAISRSRRGAVWQRLLPGLVDRRESLLPDDEALRSERNRELDGALAHLAPDGRAALLLAAQGLAGREIAISLGRSEGATRTLLCRSRIQLRSILTEGARR
jgi:RNA polymerase sigma-70 factor (ECF subfamily)